MDLGLRLMFEFNGVLRSPGFILILAILGGGQGRPGSRAFWPGRAPEVDGAPGY